MVRHSLMYLLAKDEAQPVIDEWPEIGTVELASSEECYLQNFCMGGPSEAYCKIITVCADDDFALQYISQCLRDVHVVAVRGEPRDAKWWAALESASHLGSFVICKFGRHEVVAALGTRAFWDGIELLQEAAGYLRGPAIEASPSAMRSETTLTRAIEALCASGYRTPRR